MARSHTPERSTARSTTSPAPAACRPGPITVEWRVDQTIARYPTTGPIFLQRGDLHVALPGQLYVSYPARTLGAYAAVNALAIAPFLALLNAAAESEVAEETAPVPRPEEGDRGWRRLAPPVGSIGYTGSYTEPPADIVDVSVVSVLDARGPE